MRSVRSVLFILTLSAPVVASSAPQDHLDLPQHASHTEDAPSGLVQQLRQAAEPFLDINQETAAQFYEVKGGVARLVGVEYIVVADDWHKTHADNDPPNDSPNRFGLPAFYELHVWAWRNNPNGAFVDWNPRVSCDGR